MVSGKLHKMASTLDKAWPLGTRTQTRRVRDKPWNSSPDHHHSQCELRAWVHHLPHMKLLWKHDVHLGECHYSCQHGHWFWCWQLLRTLSFPLESSSSTHAEQWHGIKQMSIWENQNKWNSLSVKWAGESSLVSCIWHGIWQMQTRHAFFSRKMLWMLLYVLPWLQVAVVLACWFDFECKALHRDQL